MPRVCTVCAHPELAAIDRALIESTPNRRIATQYGLTEAAIRRHAAAHLPSTMKLAREAAEVTRAGGLWEEALRLQDEAAALVKKAKASGFVAASAQALQCAQRGLALMTTIRAQMPEAAGPKRFTIKWQDTQPTRCKRCGFNPGASVPAPIAITAVAGAEG